MLSIFPLSFAELGSLTFPIAGESYCDEVVSRFAKDSKPQLDVTQREQYASKSLYILRSGVRRSTIKEASRRIDAVNGAAGLEHFLVNPEQHGIELITEHTRPTVEFNGDVQAFIAKLNSIPTKFPNKAIMFMGRFIFLLPLSLLKALADAGYKIILNEIYEGTIAHFFLFLDWAKANGVPMEIFIGLSCRYNADPSLTNADPAVLNADPGLGGLIKTIDVPILYWKGWLEAPPPGPNWGDGNNFNFEKGALLLNRRIRPHRVLLLAYLLSKGKLESCHWSWIGASKKPSNRRTLIETFTSVQKYIRGQSNPGLDSVTVEVLQNLLRKYPRALAKDTPGEIFKPLQHYYTRTAFSLVTETIAGTADGIWDSSAVNFHPLGFEDAPGRERRYGILSEKLFKPLAAGHPFVLIGQNNSLQMLKWLGFETYSECWDESYDKELNDLSRFLAASNLSIELIDNGFDYAKAKEIADHNFNHYWKHSNNPALVEKWLAKPLLDAYFGR